MAFIRTENRRLENACAVADENEADLAARPLVIDPAADLDVLILVGRDVFNINPFHCLKIIRENLRKVNEENLSISNFFPLIRQVLGRVLFRFADIIRRVFK